jgi:hypothetical protein
MLQQSSPSKPTQPRMTWRRPVVVATESMSQAYGYKELYSFSEWKRGHMYTQAF